MTAFDITPLQIPVADPATLAAGMAGDPMKYGITHPGTLPRAKMSSACECVPKKLYKATLYFQHCHISFCLYKLDN